MKRCRLDTASAALSTRRPFRDPRQAGPGRCAESGRQSSWREAQRWLLLCAVVLISACASAPELVSPLVSPGSFALSGRLGVRHGSEGFTGGLRWVHEAQEDRVDITSPLGQVVVAIERSPGTAHLRLADRSVTAPDIDALMAKEMGWSLPLSGLPDWLRGRPMDDRPHRAARDSTGRLATLAQDGWEIAYQGYFDAPPHLPRRLTLKSGDLEIRLVVDRWAEHP